jgi:hypothetical protein
MTMSATVFSPRSLRMPPVLAGGLLVGTLDLVFACAWWALAVDIAPIRILQSIGAGVYGPASFEGGLRTAAVGGVLHYGIATAMVFAYALAATRWRELARQPWRWGPLYGVLLYVLMNYIVVPLSAASSPTKFNAPWVFASIAMHMLIGAICAHAARGATRG